MENDKKFSEEVKDLLKPIAVHEAKSAYYKAKLLGVMSLKAGKAIKSGALYLKGVVVKKKEDHDGHEGD